LIFTLAKYGLTIMHGFEKALQFIDIGTFIFDFVSKGKLDQTRCNDAFVAL